MRKKIKEYISNGREVVVYEENGGYRASDLQEPWTIYPTHKELKPAIADAEELMKVIINNRRGRWWKALSKLKL